MAILLAGFAGASRAATEAPVITIIAPQVIYPEVLEDPSTGGEASGLKFCRITVRSESFTRGTAAPGAAGGTATATAPPFQLGTDIGLYLNDQKTEIVEAKSITPLIVANGGSLAAHKVYGVLRGNELELALPWSPFSLDWPDYHGKVHVQVRVGSAITDRTIVVITGLEERLGPVIAAIAVALVVLAFPIWLVIRKRRDYFVAGKRYRTFATLFLDKETDSYSLSKAQFYAWTAAAIFGYIFLLVARSLVQGKLVFSDIPANLPALIFISGGTMIASRGVTNVKGAGGAGPIYPSSADFVSSGGMVVPEKFQFFVWTIVGILSFLFLVVLSDPATVDGLPTVPPGFLGLMGISSLGYLGGKSVRKAGPIIDAIKAQRGSLLLEIVGRKLSRNATLRIDEVDVPVTDTLVAGSEPDDDASPTEFYKKLSVTAKTVDASIVRGGNHKCRLSNPDGQEAEWFFTLPSTPSITTVSPAVRNPQKNPTLTLTVTGVQLSTKASIKIDDQAVTPDHKMTVTPEGEDEAGDNPTLYKTLILTFRGPPDAWCAPEPTKHVLEIINTPTERTRVDWSISTKDITTDPPPDTAAGGDDKK